MNQNFNLPYVIFEIANVHGGNQDALVDIVNQYSQIEYQQKGIKFQPLKPDQIALPDYKWFPVYQELYFDPGTWAGVIELAANSGDVWLDLFDTYGVEILQANKQFVAGIKLQASVLDNLALINALSNLDLSQFRLMINVSGYEISSIEKYLDQFRKLDFSDVVLQMGFQSYPTDIADTGLQKIAVLKAAFPGLNLCMADHAPAEDDVALQIPAWSLIAGCNYIEKHFCAKRSDAKYDFYSALEPDEFRKMLNNFIDLIAAFSGSFTSTPEKEYLEGSYQAPIAQHDIAQGGLIGLSDLSFRRTNQTGFTWPEIISRQNQFNVLARTVVKDSTISTSDFRKAKIGAIVACRMKSSRLKQKALLPIHGVPSVERCLQNCLQMEEVDDVILATSSLEEDQVLKNHTLGGRANFWQGDPDDVIQRYLGACEEYGIDVIVRVTADCPAISPEITNLLLKHHFAAGADYTAALHCAVGSSPEIYNAEALQRVIDMMGKAEYSEYMTWYMQNNADVFKINLVTLPDELQREYRLTIDYQEDLEMFEGLYFALDEKNLAATATNIFSILDDDSTLAGINQALTLSYKTDEKLIEKLNRVTRISAD